MSELDMNWELLANKDYAFLTESPLLGNNILLLTLGGSHAYELLRELIRDNSNEGDIVFDPCCGSGAHCLVAKEENRNYIGVELKNQYYEIAKERLQ